MGDELKPRSYVEAGAMVSGVAALAIARFLRDHEEEWREFVGRFAATGMEIASARAAIEYAAERHKASPTADAQPGKAIAVDGSADVAAAEIEPESSDMWVTTDEASFLLGVRPRRVRQLASSGELAARRVGRIWLIDRASAEEAKSRRAS